MTVPRREDCGPDGCTIDWLTSARLDVDGDPVEFQKLATDAGWGDGLPLIPPTEERVRAHVAASGRFPEEHLADLPPRNGRCTVEKVAVNAVMAGAPAASMALLCTAVEAMAEPDFNLFALNTTTSCVVPGVFVNGRIRHDLDLPYEAGCFGGAAGPAPAIGRALRLLMRNVGGQVVGVSSKSVFGQPGRVTGIVVGEWEEQSPWEPLATRRGLAAGVDALTVHGCTGTIDVADLAAESGADLVEVIGKSLAFAGTNAFIGSHHGAEILGVPRAAVGRPLRRDVSGCRRRPGRLSHHAALPDRWWPVPHRAKAERDGRVDADGMVASWRARTTCWSWSTAGWATCTRSPCTRSARPGPSRGIDT